ncbi:hypothetical protein [Roseivirga seohaensis]|uniref:hypothetical protein n=1 Tax=Roseivirga seohaensis TaxID=1914963 RepID=UPI003BAD88A1
MTKRKITQNFIIFSLLLLSFSFANGQTILEDSVMNGNNFQKAAFRLWIGKDIQRVRGVIVMVPGSNGNGRDMVYQPEWQALANKHNMAILAADIKDKRSPNMAIEQYADVKNGTGQVMLDVLSRLATKSGHPELNTVPFALWGMSAGGEFNYEFACWKPERVITFIVNKGGVYYTALASEATRAVPGVFLTGEIDNPYRNNIVKGIYSVNRRFGAKWIFAEEPGQGHEFAKSEAFTLKYFDEIIPIRLDENGNLKPLSEKAFLGEIGTGKVAATGFNNSFTDITSWLPNAAIADLWKTLFQ